MADDFEKMMNEKIDDASLHDVLPEFDKSAAWDELEPRIPAKKKKPVFVWWSHAAAIIGGILIGSTMLQLYLRQDSGNSTPNVAVIEKPAEQPTVLIKTDTIFIAKEVEPIYVARPEKIIIAPKPVRKHPEAVVAQKAKETVEIKEDITNEPVSIVEPIEVVAKAPVKKIKPIHLLDIDNEDRSDALYNNEPEVTQKSGFAFHISAKRLPAGNTEQKSLLTGLLKK